MKSSFNKKSFVMIVILSLALIGAILYIINHKTNIGLGEKWYSIRAGELNVWYFSDTNEYSLSSEDNFLEDLQEGIYKYNDEKSTIYLSIPDSTYYIKDKTENSMVLSEQEEGYEGAIYLYKDISESKDYYTVKKYYDKIKDKEGFCIKNGILYVYVGKEKEVTVPSNVKEIYPNCFSGDYNHGVNLKKVIIPGTVEKIDEQAFAFTNAKEIYIEEGVKEIDEFAFSNSYINEIHFPSSIEKIGIGIMETEEGLNKTSIYVKEGSLMDKYFKENEPYGKVDICIEK